MVQSMSQAMRESMRVMMMGWMGLVFSSSCGWWLGLGFMVWLVVLVWVMGQVEWLLVWVAVSVSGLE